MCYHVSTPTKGQLGLYASAKQMIVQGEYEKYYHVSGFARPFLPVTLNSESKIIQPAQWKLIPHWVKTEEEAKKYANTLNAESSEIFDKPSYRSYIGKKRGLLYIDGFYEPHASNGKDNDQNFYIYRPNHEIFTLGIVFNPWINPVTGELINTFSVITVPGNSMMNEIHNTKKRMPLYIAPEDHEGWLNAETKEEIQSYFKPAMDDDLKAHQIQMRVTAPKKGEDTNTPAAQMEVDNNPGLAGELF